LTKEAFRDAEGQHIPQRLAMTALTLTCNQCGASLEVPEETRFLTCTACSYRLEVHRSDDAAYTEVLEVTDSAKLELELERLKADRVTEKERHGSVGTLSLLQHGTLLAMIVGLVLAGYGVAVDMQHLGGPGPGPVPYVCIFLGLFLVVGWVLFFLATGGHRSKIAEYHRVSESYEYRVRRLLQDIEASKKRDEDQLPD
jgi:hypothetical protein